MFELILIVFGCVTIIVGVGLVSVWAGATASDFTGWSKLWRLSVAFTGFVSLITTSIVCLHYGLSGLI